MQFAKLHGCGNDYIFVKETDIKGVDASKAAKFLSDRKKGIGTDGLIIAGASEIADIKMEMYNADGSRGKMCGNGIRCLGKYAFERKLTIKTVLRVETDSGIKQMWLYGDGTRISAAKVNMGKPVFCPDDIPVLLPGENIIDREVCIERKKYTVTCLSMGNPHTVIFTDDIDKIQIGTEGKLIENAEIFPDRTNVMFVQVVSEKQLKMDIWERGSGITMACGTGACAALVAGYITKRCGNEAEVLMPGGTVEVTYDTADGNVYLLGDANEVFTGEVVE